MPHTILLADDSKTIQRAVEIVFEKEADFDVVSVGSGADAIARARELSPAVIIADHAMPGGGGLEVASALRDDPATAAIPVLVLSGSSQPFDAEGAVRLGVQHLQKPFDSVSLLDRVQRLCGLKAADAPPPSPFAHLRPAGSTAAAPAASVAAVPPPAAPVAAVPPISPFGPPPVAAVPAASAPVSPFGAPPASSFPSTGFATTTGEPPAAPRSPFGPPPETMPSAAPIVESSPPAEEQAPSPFLDATAVLDRSALGLGAPLPPLNSAAGMASFTPTPEVSEPVAAPVVEAASAAVVHTVEAAHATVVETASAALATTSEAVPSNEAISATAREIIERVVWEVVPELAETLIREEIARLLRERRA
ncbi:MAG: response regulator [Myxococcota bacterium]